MVSAAGDDFILLHEAYGRLSDQDARALLRPRRRLAGIRIATRLQAIAAQLLGPASPHQEDRPVLVDLASFDRELCPCESLRRAAMAAHRRVCVILTHPCDYLYM
jgi:hypothetical protein